MTPAQEQAVAEALQLMSGVVCDLDSAKPGVDQKQLERMQRLLEIAPLLDGSPQAALQLLRGAAAVAAALAAFTPTLPSGGDDLGAVALLPHLSAGGAASMLLLHALTLTKGQGLASPTAAYRLAGCAGLAVRSGPAVVQAAQRYVAGAPPAEQKLATHVVTACQVLLSTGVKAHLLVAALGQQQPGPALRATTCKRERLLALCLACAPVLRCWRERLGPQAVHLSSLVRLAMLSQPHAEHELAGERGTALLTLLAEEYTAVSRQVCSLGPAQLAAGSAGELLLTNLRGLGLPLTIGAAGLQDAMRNALAVCTAAVLTHLLPVLVCDGSAHVAMAVAQQMDMQLAVVHRVVTSAASPQRRGEGLQPPLLPAACLKGLAVALGAISALVEAEAQRLPGLAGDSAADSLDNLISFCGPAGGLGQVCGRLEAAHGAQWSGIALGDLAAAAAAAEAALRLCGRLVQLWPQLAATAGQLRGVLCSELNSMSSAAKRLGDLLLNSLWMALCHRHGNEQLASPGADLAACSRACATAAKVGLLLGDQAAPDRAAAENDLRLVATASQVVLFGRSGWNDFLFQGGHSFHRSYAGAMLPLLNALYALTARRNMTPGSILWSKTAAYLRFLVWHVVELDGSVPYAAASQRQQLVRIVCEEWSALVAGTVGEADLADLVEALQISEFTHGHKAWQRSVASLVRGGLLDTATTAVVRLLAGSSAPGAQVALLIQKLWALVEGLGSALLAQPVAPADAVLVIDCRQRIEAVRQLRPALQRQRLRSRGWWEREVAGTLLPSLKRLAEAVEAGEGGEGQPEDAAALLQAAYAHATRACAHPGCTNLRGVSEGRLRGQRCGGCGVVRYCSHECARADWAQHGRVCGMLRQGATA